MQIYIFQSRGAFFKSIRVDVIRDKRNPRKGENAEERNCLIVSVLVLQLRAVRLSLATMERYEKQSNCDSTFCHSFLGSRRFGRLIFCF